jgi:hypothetical protein
VRYRCIYAVDPLKEQHERAIADQLLGALKCGGKFLRRGKDDGEPDVIYSINGRTVGVEIGTAYLGGGAAKVDWDLARGKAQRGSIDLGRGDERMVAAVQRLLDEKCLNTYSGADAVWLCIEAHDPAPYIWQMEQLVAALSVPDQKYERVYVGFHALPSDGGGFRVYRVYPPG